VPVAGGHSHQPCHSASHPHNPMAHWQRRDWASQRWRRDRCPGGRSTRLVRIRHILVMLAALAVIAGTLATANIAMASPVDAAVPHTLAQDPQPTGIPPTEIPPTEIPPTQAPPTEVPPTEIPPTEIPPTEAPPTATAPPEDPPTQGPAPTFASDSPAPTEESRISITVLPGTGGPAAPASGSPNVALVLIATALLAASLAIRGSRRQSRVTN
jgi:hypothetical protein